MGIERIGQTKAPCGKAGFSLAAAFFVLAALSACSGTAGKFRLLAGNVQFGGGHYREAVAGYLGALDGPNAPYAEFALGTVYLEMDENDAALARFESAEAGTEDEGLLYRIHYNRGIVFFGQGNFEAAAGEFRAALEKNPSRTDAKRNLELSLLSLNRAGSNQEPENKTSPAAAGAAENAALMDYMRRREENRWRNQEWQEPGSVSGPDW